MLFSSAVPLAGPIWRVYHQNLILGYINFWLLLAGKEGDDLKIRISFANR